MRLAPRFVAPATLAAALTLLAASAPAQPPARALSAESARADLDVLQRAVAEAHGAPYRFTPKRALDSTFDALRRRIDGPIAHRAFVGVVSEAIAAIRDGHSRVELDSATAAAVDAARRFPMRVALEGERLVVVLNDSPNDTTVTPGMEIVTLNGRPAGEVVARLLAMLPGDGFVETGKRDRLVRGFGRWYWLYVDPVDRFTVTARDAGGRVVTATLDGVTDAERARADNPVNRAMRDGLARIEPSRALVALRFVGDGSVGHLRVRAFDGASFVASLDSAFDTLRARGARSLVLDLRGNGGGVDMYGAALVARLVDGPFRYFDRIRVATIRPSFATWKPSTFDELRAGTVRDSSGEWLVTPALHPGVAEQQPAANAFGGRLVVLTDGATFSTAADVSAVLRGRRRATFVGEETGGTYEGNTSGLNALVVLPASRLRLKVQMYGYVNAVPPAAPGRGIVPDETIPTRVADLLRGVDPALERAVALAR